MIKLKSIIVEDDSKAAKSLLELLKKHFSDFNVVQVAKSAPEAFIAITKEKPDVVFMDVQLGADTAFDVLNRFEGINFELVFTTAFDQYALQAFDYPAPHFLTKPIDFEKLGVVLGRVQRNCVSKKLSEDLPKYKNSDNPERLALTTSSTTELIDFVDIEYLAAEGSYTEIYLKDGTKRISSRILGHYEKSLDMSLFCRIHRKYIVNIKHIVRYDKAKAVNLFLTSGAELQTSIVYKSRLLRHLKTNVAF